MFRRLSCESDRATSHDIIRCSNLEVSCTLLLSLSSLFMLGLPLFHSSTSPFSLHRPFSCPRLAPAPAACLAHFYQHYATVPVFSHSFDALFSPSFFPVSLRACFLVSHFWRVIFVSLPPQKPTRDTVSDLLRTLNGLAGRFVYFRTARREYGICTPSFCTVSRGRTAY